MKLKDYTKEELELLSYKDITNLILEEEGNLSTLELFKRIINLLGLSERIIESKIGDYYTSLTTDKRFLLLENGTWDLRSRHTSDKVIIPLDEEDEEIEDIKDELEGTEDGDIESDDFDPQDGLSDEDFVEDEDLSDLVVLDEDELDMEQ
jgi:DNA-directed RNA polymerase subunit delta